jgi:uncharacterized OB-fold protein
MTDRPELRPAPPGTDLAGAYFAWHASGELRFQRCTACRTWTHPPRRLCPECGTATLAWERSTGRGVLFSWTRTHYGFSPDFAASVPYLCAVVELDEGPRVMTSLVEADQAELAIGLAVEVEFEPRRDDTAVAVFRLVDPPPA